MPFTCSVCGLEIQIGEIMLSNAKMDLAHKPCIDRHLREHPDVSVAPIKETVVSMVVEKVSGPGFGNPTAAIGDSCVPSKPTDLCVECGQKAISMCPYCRAYVHHGYGNIGTSCSLLHEGKCKEAKESREPSPKPMVMSGILYPDLGPAKKNGKHVTTNTKKKGRSRR